MAQRRNNSDRKGGSAKDRRPLKKKTSILTTESIEWIDYKDVNLLRRFMSERAKIRARRVTGNDQKQQAAVSRAIKLAREMALLPYSVRQVTQRSKGRRDRGERGERGDRDRDLQPTAADEVAQVSAEATSDDAIDEIEGLEDEDEIEVEAGAE
jgi:small subunit ribosomal protein S18